MKCVGRYVRLKEINSELITKEVKKLCIEGNIFLGDDVIKSFKDNLQKEESELGKDILNILIENATIAKDTHIPICQDTGMAVFFVEIGQDVIIKGDTLTEAINKGVSEGFSILSLLIFSLPNPFGAYSIFK